ncbi:MAG: tetratricopeptide repeat protein, partial [Planctomycetota bacterium]
PAWSRRTVKRINLKVLAILVATIVGLLVGVFMLRRFQVSRNAGNLAKLAKQRLEEGKPAEAVALSGRYLGLRPEDNEAYAAFAKLMLARAESPDATRNDLGRAYNTLEEALRRDPENDDLRRQLAKFQLRIGRASDAREHLDILRERLREGTVQQPDAKDSLDGTEVEAIDTQAIELLMARSYLGVGDVGEAGKIVAEMVGFDLEARAFVEDRDLTGPTEAYVILAAILEEKLDNVGAATKVLEKMVEKHADEQPHDRGDEDGEDFQVDPFHGATTPSRWADRLPENRLPDWGLSERQTPDSSSDEHAVATPPPGPRSPWLNARGGGFTPSTKDIRPRGR